MIYNVEDIARRARFIARRNYSGGHENIGTWEDAVVRHLAISEALKEPAEVARGEPQGSIGMAGERPPDG